MLIQEGPILPILLYGAESWCLTIFYAAYFSPSMCKVYVQSSSSSMCKVYVQSSSPSMCKVYVQSSLTQCYNFRISIEDCVVKNDDYVTKMAVTLGWSRGSNEF